MKTCRRNRAAAIAVGLLLAVAVGACGGDDDSGADTTVASTSTAASATTASGGETTTSPSTSAGTGSTAGASDEEWQAIVEAAQEEGSVTFWTSNDPANAEAFKVAFEAAYPGITMNVSRGLIQDLLPKLELQFQNGDGEADIWLTGDPTALTEKFGQYLVPAVGPDIPDAAKADEDPGTLVQFTVPGFGWNTDLFPEGIDSPEDLLSPDLADGRLGVVDAGSGSFVTFWKHLEDAYGEEFVEQLAAQNPSVYASSLPMREALAAGEIAATVLFPYSQDLFDAGAPVGFYMPEDPWAIPTSGYIFTTAPHPNAAQLAMNFALTVEGETALSRNFVSVLPDIPGTVGDIGIIKNPIDLGALTPEDVAAYQAKWNGLFR